MKKINNLFLGLILISSTTMYAQFECGKDSVQDIDGNWYRTVRLGRCWMAENLSVTHYSDGETIPHVTDSAAWDNLTETEKAWCYYNNSESKGDTFGALYTWTAAMNGATSSDTNPSGVQGVCPEGWHLPSDEEFKWLEMHIGMSSTEADKIGDRGTNEGSKLAGNKDLWQNQNILEYSSEFGSSGFNALPSGQRMGGTFSGIYIRTSFWTSSEWDNNRAWSRLIQYDSKEVSRKRSFLKVDGRSVRCVLSSPGRAQINGPDTACRDSIACFNASADYASSFNWYLPSDWFIISGEIKPHMCAKVGDKSGYVIAEPGNSSGIGTPDSLYVNIKSKPINTFISGDSIACENDSNVYYSANANNVSSYFWEVPTDWTITQGQGTSNIYVNIGSNSGNVIVTPLNNCGNGKSDSINVTVFKKPDSAYISGTNSVNKNEKVCYIATANHASSFHWEVPTDWTITQGQGTSNMCAIVGSTSGNITAIPYNNSCNGIKGKKYVEVVENDTNFKCGSNSIQDIDGNWYQTVAINKQCWMKGNLKVTHYSDSTPIPHVVEQEKWDTLKNTEKAYCWHNNDSAQYEYTGALYTWSAAMNGATSSNTNPSGIQGVCPDGWHLPSDSEWKELEMFLGMTQNEANSTIWRGTNEGSKLKSKNGWGEGYNGTNESGFSALPAGDRRDNGDFTGGTGVYFWTSTEKYSDRAWFRLLGNYKPSLIARNFGFLKTNGFSVRCVCNSSIIDTTKPTIISDNNDTIIYVDTLCEANLPNYESNLKAIDNYDHHLDISQTPIPGTKINKGIQVKLLVEDDAGNSSSTMFNVSLVDSTAPSINNATFNDTTIFGCNMILSDYTSGIDLQDNCDTNFIISQSPEPGTLISEDTRVTVTVKDNSGNSRSKMFNVSLIDSTAPIINTTFNDTTVFGCNMILSDYTSGIDLQDNCDTNFVISQSPKPDFLISKDTVIKIEVKDNSGNASIKSFKINIVDTVEPRISCLNDTTIYINENKNFYKVQGKELDPLDTSDNCFVDTLKNSFNDYYTLDGSEIPKGSTKIYWQIIDASGNIKKCNSNITISNVQKINSLSKKGILIYPNPTTGKVHFEFTKDNVQQIKIFNISAQLLIQKSDIQKTEIIDLSGYSNGVYIIELLTQKNSLVTKIIKK